MTAKILKMSILLKERFDAIASENGVDGKEIQENLLESLHLLGICLWYKDIEEFDMLVLNPDWITNGIYKVINWAQMHNKSKHTIALEDYENIFKDEKNRYPEGKFEHIFKLMKKYELAFPKGGGKITVPHLLREDQPAELPDFPIDGSLMIKYISEQPLPPNTVCRLIVKHYEEIRNDGEVWRYGVVLKYKNDTLALIYEDDRIIRITVKGRDRSEYIAKLRDTMNTIFGSYKSDKPNLQYRIIYPDRQVEVKPYEKEEVTLSDKTIINHINKQKDILTDSGRDIALEWLENTAKQYQIEGGLHIHIGDNNNIDAKDSNVTVAAGDSIINDNSTQITVNKPEIEDWMRSIKEELEKNNVQNEELASLLKTLETFVNVSKTNETIIKTIVEAVKSIGYGIISSAAWQALMANLPIWPNFLMDVMTGRPKKAADLSVQKDKNGK